MPSSSALTLLLIALGIAANPPGIIVQLGLLSAANGRRKAVAYLLGLVGSLLFFAGLSVALLGRVDLSQPSTPTTAAYVVHLIGGAVCFAAGVWLWRQPAEAVGGFVGKAMKNLDTISLGTCALLGFLLVNYPLEFAGATTILQAKLDTTTAVIVFVLFCIVAASTIWLPLVLSISMGDRWERWSQVSRDWIVKDGNAVLGAMICGIGVVIAVSAILGLLGK